MRRRLTKLATVSAVTLAMLTVGVGGASSASADTIGTSCSEVYYMGESYLAWNDYYGQVIVDLMYSPCVTGTIYSFRGTGYWFAVR